MPDGGVQEGDEITYSFLVTNTGTVSLAGVTLADPMPGLVWVTGPELGDLAPGTSATGTATYTVTDADVARGSLYNAATATGSTPDGGTATDDDDDTVTTINPCVTTTLIPALDTESANLALRAMFRQDGGNELTETVTAEPTETATEEPTDEPTDTGTPAPSETAETPATPVVEGAGLECPTEEPTEVPTNPTNPGGGGNPGGGNPGEGAPGGGPVVTDLPKTGNGTTATNDLSTGLVIGALGLLALLLSGSFALRRRTRLSGHDQ